MEISFAGEEPHTELNIAVNPLNGTVAITNIEFTVEDRWCDLTIKDFRSRDSCSIIRYWPTNMHTNIRFVCPETDIDNGPSIFVAWKVLDSSIIHSSLSKLNYLWEDNSINMTLCYPSSISSYPSLLLNVSSDSILVMFLYSTSNTTLMQYSLYSNEFSFDFPDGLQLWYELNYDDDVFNPPKASIPLLLTDNTVYITADRYVNDHDHVRYGSKNITPVEIQLKKYHLSKNSAFEIFSSYIIIHVFCLLILIIGCLWNKCFKKAICYKKF